MGTSAISRDPEILGGIPVFEGTRVPVQTFLNCLEEGYTIEEFLDDFPTVSREQTIQVIEEAKERLDLMESPNPVR